jgi:hypothetical protein
MCTSSLTDRQKSQPSGKYNFESKIPLKIELTVQQVLQPFNKRLSSEIRNFSFFAK